MTGVSSKQATSEDVECGLFSECALVICIDLQEIREEGPTAAAEYLLAQSDPFLQAEARQLVMGMAFLDKDA